MKEKRFFTVRRIAEGGIIAALYVVLTWLSYILGLSGQNLIQFRLSEALTVLPFFTFSAVPGLTIGCLISNIVTGAAPWDVVFGTLATLLGAIGTYLLRKYRYAASIPPIISNTVIVPFVVYFCYGLDVTFASYPIWLGLLLTAGTVFIGEFACCGILGTLLQTVLLKYPKLFGDSIEKKKG